MKTIEELKNELAEMTAQARAIQEKADGDKRELTAEETTEMSAILDACDIKDEEIKRRDRLQAREASLNAPGERKVRPTDVAVVDEKPARAGALKPTPGLEGARDKGRGGFKSFGEFSRLVHRAGIGADTDPRLRVLNAASTYGQEAVGADGGYLVPPDFRTQIMEKVQAEDSLMSYCDQIDTSSNSVTIPVDENEPWSASGITVNWVGEGGTAAQSKPVLQNQTVHAQKLIALVPVTDELLSDAGQIESYLRNKAPAKIAYKVNDAILNGTGAGMPTGYLKSGALITVAAEGGQTAGTINFSNISKMYSAMYAPCRRRAVWVTNQDAEPQFDNLVIPGTTVTAPAYLPPGGISNSPYNTLKGRPVIFSEAAGALGAVGDISFVDLTQYMTVVKNGGVRTDVSMHLYFDQDATAFRFILRIGGQPWWKAPVTRAKSSNKLSAFVTLAAR